jgi:hypothetical protein
MQINDLGANARGTNLWHTASTGGMMGAEHVPSQAAMRIAP